MTGIIFVTQDRDTFEFSIRLQGALLPIGVLPTAFTVSVGLYVVVWMQLRSRRRGD